jgi:tetratricopeptide (TPR) repeat protein
MTFSWPKIRQATASGLLLALMASSQPAYALDPFRTGATARPLGSYIQGAFEDFFRTGDYQNAAQKLTKAQVQNPDEPLVFTLQAVLAYQNGQVEQMVALAKKTRQIADALEAKDPCRSHLYAGLSQGLEGSSFYLKDGVLGLPKVLTYVPGMFSEINRARDVSPDDPEVNLFVAYIDVLLGKQDQAIDEFRKAAPSYLSFRGQALAYRDKKAYDDALSMAEKGLAAAPKNPDLFYLKGQILGLQGKAVQSVTFFNKALDTGKQLPEGIRKQIIHERDIQVQLASAQK